MSTKECSEHKEKRQNRIRRLCACLLVFCFIVLLVFLITWAILQPKKPRFIVRDATIYNFKIASSPDLLTSNFQITVSSRNPNDNIGIYYDKLDVYASYRGQQITYYTDIPSTYQGHKGVNVWSPFISGTSVPIAPFIGEALSTDQASGGIQMTIKINGRVRWKVGTFVSGRYHLHVTCPVYIPCGNKNDNFNGETSIKFPLLASCKVSV
ncbi:VAMP protein SEC22 [Heracleum sosnowskyi]|uniref:VAMP protein SEC22 n=1 Tax=Heracleum sosnowskyi TaxID=360622 RepID=A0AAD8JI16_9APIA|nr:VAMP protein SEC22 [Heracleum sosnowskyi]